MRVRAIDRLPALIWVAGKDGLRTYFNEPWLRFTGRAAQQELGMGWAEGIHPQDARQYLTNYRSSVETHQPFSMEYRLRRADGEYRWLLDQACPSHSPADEFEGLIGSSIDINDLKQSDPIHAWLAAIIESSDDAIISKDLDGTITSWNAAAERIFEYTASEAVGQNICIIIPPELRTEEVEIQEKLRAGRRIDHYETLRVAKSGRTVNVSLSISPVKDAQGRVTGASKIARDITARVRDQGALRESEQRFRLAQAAAHIGTWEWDTVQNSSSLSAELHDIFGIQASDRQHTETWRSRVLPDDLPAVEAAMENARNSGEIEVEYRYQHPQRGLRWLFCKGSRSSDKSDSRMFGVVLDITERKRAEVELREIQQALELRVKERTAELERAEQSLRALSARLMQAQDDERRRLARELHDSAGQMLAALSMNLEPIYQESKVLGAKFEKALAESLDLVGQLSRELRTISHLLHPPMLDEAGLRSALQWYVEGFAARAKISVQFEMASDLGRLSRELETAIFRIVQESLTNIHRHSGSPTARIRLARAPDLVMVEVSDQGKGMRDNVGRFLKSGVGIQGMRERVRQLGGHLEVQSGPTGTTVLATFSLEHQTLRDQNKVARVAV